MDRPLPGAGDPPDPGSARTLVVVLNWNGDQELLDCLASLNAGDIAGEARHGDGQTPGRALERSYEILLVDNGSTTGSFEQACAAFPGIHLLRNATNDYWAGGNNKAIAWAARQNYNWLVFCNNDIIVDQRWPEVLARIGDDPCIGVIGYNVIGEYRREARELFEQSCFNFRIEDLQWHDDTYISGCFLAVRSLCLEALGGFDPIYRMYAEEDDFLIRVRLAGWRTVRCNAPIWHVSELTSRRVPLLTSYLAIRNTLRLRLKFGPHRLRSAVGFAVEVMMRMLNPFQPVDLVNSHLRRLKPSPNPLINLGILVAACGWNLLHLPASVRLGLEQRRQALAVRAGRR